MEEYLQRPKKENVESLERGLVGKISRKNKFLDSLGNALTSVAMIGMFSGVLYHGGAPLIYEKILFKKSPEIKIYLQLRESYSNFSYNTKAFYRDSLSKIEQNYPDIKKRVSKASEESFQRSLEGIGITAFSILPLVAGLSLLTRKDRRKDSST